MKSIRDDREMPITAAALQHVIKNTFVQSAEHHQSLASTNDYGITLARNQNKLTANAVHLIYTESQTHGRGRGNNHWLSAPGSLTFSLLVSRPQASATVASLQSAVAIAKACSAYANHAAVRVKWPNDIYLERQKLGGILIESPANTDRWVIGIGINVNNKTKNLEEGGANPIALADIADSVVNREDFLHLLLKNLGDVWDSPNAVTAAPADWDTWCLLRGKAVVVERSEGSLSGICRGIDTSGNLLVEETYSANEPSRLHPLASVKNIRWE